MLRNISQGIGLGLIFWYILNNGKRSFKSRDRGIYGIDLAQDRDRWRDIVNVEMNL
jgi:hypothetical protein